MDSATYLAQAYHAEPVGLGIEYDGFDQYASGYRTTPQRSTTASPVGASVFPDDRDNTNKSQYLGTTSPSTPQSDGVRTRSGRSVRQTQSPTTPMDTPRSTPGSGTKRVREKKLKSRKLSAPLSELTKDMDVPVRDMEAWVNRPVEERLEEAKKRKGYITRPMNSFMLYRSAYAERTKAWCAENNHQVVSSVSGESWPMEPAEIRNFYNGLAQQEKENHQAAHPEYKFSPAKPGFAGRKRKGTDDSDLESLGGFSDGDPDADYGPPTKRSKKRVGREAGFPAARTSHPTPIIASDAYELDAYGNPISWSQEYAPRPLPQIVSQPHPYGVQYYQPAIQQAYMLPVEESPYAVHDPYADFEASQGLIGLPTHSQYELHALHSQNATPAPFAAPAVEHYVDPLLSAYETQLPEESLYTQPQQHMYAHPMAAPVESYSVAPDVHAALPGMGEYVSYQPQTFPPESSSPVFETQADEFERYWEEGPGPVAEAPMMAREEQQ